MSLEEEVLNTMVTPEDIALARDIKDAMNEVTFTFEFTGGEFGVLMDSMLIVYNMAKEGELDPPDEKFVDDFNSLIEKIYSSGEDCVYRIMEGMGVDPSAPQN
jgi:hypothetical protein